MRNSVRQSPSVPVLSPITGLPHRPVVVEHPTDKEPPRRPDWLMILIVGLLLLTLLIAWLTDLP